MLSKHLIDEAVDGLKTWKIYFKLDHPRAGLSDSKFLILCVQSSDVKDAIYRAGATTDFHEWYKNQSAFLSPVVRQGGVHKLMAGDGTEDVLAPSNLLGSMIDRLSGQSFTMTPLHNLFYDHGRYHAQVFWHAWDDGPDEIDGDDIDIGVVQSNCKPSNLHYAPVSDYCDGKIPPGYPGYEEEED